MTRVFGIQTIVLGPGVSGEELEKFLRESWASLPVVEGIRMYLLRGKYGQRVGEYVLLVEIDSLELRDQLYPPDGNYSPEALPSWKPTRRCKRSRMPSRG